MVTEDLGQSFDEVFKVRVLLGLDGNDLEGFYGFRSKLFKFLIHPQDQHRYQQRTESKNH